MVCVTVRDHGPGVPPDELEAIFLPFVQSSSAQPSQGHGLGLAIAQRVVKAHDGTIGAFNAESGGLRVEILLPLSGGTSACITLSRAAAKSAPVIRAIW